MDKTFTVAVVAPDGVFRRSIEFALKAEGWTVEAHDTVQSACVSPGKDRYECAVVDDVALRPPGEAWSHLEQLRRPVVVLSDRPQAAQVFFPVSTIVGKPLLGKKLVEAVAATLADHQAPDRAT